MINNKKINSIILSIFIIFSFFFIFPVKMIYADTQEFQSIGLKKEQVINTCAPPVNVKDSLVLSIVMMCLPGILEKMNEHRQNKCLTAKCAYEAVINELDPQFCYDQDAYRTCKFIVGEIFALPPMHLLEYYRNLMAQVIANPIGYAYSAAVIGARGYITGSCRAPLLCDAFSNIPIGYSVALVVITDTASIIQTAMEIFENGFNFFTQRVNYCEGMDEIKLELEKVKEYS